MLGYADTRWLRGEDLSACHMSNCARDILTRLSDHPVYRVYRAARIEISLAFDYQSYWRGEIY